MSQLPADPPPSWRKPAGIFMILLVIALCAPVLAPYDPTTVDARAILSPASRDHWLGTDNLGRDTLSRLMHGARWPIIDCASN